MRLRIAAVGRMKSGLERELMDRYIQRANAAGRAQALAPFEVADYVAAHECAHLLELNHGPRFWAHVADLIDRVPAHRAWLKAHGATLHAFGRADIPA